MKIAVIAANGRTGKAFVSKALKKGHQIRAGVHRKNNLFADPNLEVVQCDASLESDLKNLIKGQDAVVSFIGHNKGSLKDVQTNAMKQLNKAMKDEGLKRIVSLTGTGVRYPGDQITIMDRILNFSINLIDPARIKDGINHARFLEQSDLDWTILRVLKLSNTPEKPFNLKEHGPTKLYVSREEVANAALSVLEQKSFIKKAPILSKI